MNKLAAILIALSCSVQAQTFITVTADTNRVIRTNFSLVSSQVSDLSDATFAISNITGLQAALDVKLATNGDAIALTNFPALLLRTNGSALTLTNFPDELLRTNGSALTLTNFPADLLRTNGDAASLTNFPTLNQNTTGTASNVTGVVDLANGGTGATNASAARTALELGTAATNDATAFQPANTNLTALAGGDGSSLTNVTITDASSLTNFPADLLRTNGDAAGLTNFPSVLLLTNGSAASLTNFPSELLRTNGDGAGLTNISVDLTTVLPSYTGNSGKVLAVASGETDVEWTAISNTVTDASTLTNFPAIILQTNSAETNFPSFLLRTNGSAADLTSFPAIVLQTNSSESAFPQALLRTNGDASGLTNLPASGGASATNIGQIRFTLNDSRTTSVSGGAVGDIANGLTVRTSSGNNTFARASVLLTAQKFVATDTTINFTNNFAFGMHLSADPASSAAGNGRVFVGTAVNNNVTNDPTNIMIGWRTKDQEIYAAMYNGTAYSEPFSTNGVFQTNGTSYVWTWVEGDGQGNVSWYVSGQLLGTTTNGPTNTSEGRYLAVSIINDTGETISNSTIRVLNFITQFQ